MNVRSLIQISGSYLVKKDENTIEVKYRNTAYATMTKDTKVLVETIKEAKPMPATKAQLEANVWQLSQGYGKHPVYLYFNQDKVYAAVEDQKTYKKYSEKTFTYEEDNGAAVVKIDNHPFKTELIIDGRVISEPDIIKLINTTYNADERELYKIEKNEHPTADEVKNAQ